MSDSGLIQITVNGSPREVPRGLVICDLLSLLQLNPKFLAVERNRELVPRTRHAECRLEAGDQLEIVTMVGGG